MSALDGRVSTIRAVLRIGMIGLGYWGPNYARVVTELPGATLSVVCDASTDALEFIRTRVPGARTTTDAADVFSADDVDAVIVATPTSTHCELAFVRSKCGQARAVREAARLDRRRMRFADRTRRGRGPRPLHRAHVSLQPGRAADGRADREREPRQAPLLRTLRAPDSARSGRTSTRSGISRRTTSRSCSISSARSPFRSRQPARRSSAKASRTSSSRSFALRTARSPAYTSRGSIRTRCGA